MRHLPGKDNIMTKVVKIIALLEDFCKREKKMRGSCHRDPLLFFRLHILWVQVTMHPVDPTEPMIPTPEPSPAPKKKTTSCVLDKRVRRTEETISTWLRVVRPRCSVTRTARVCPSSEDRNFYSRNWKTLKSVQLNKRFSFMTNWTSHPFLF